MISSAVREAPATDKSQSIALLPAPATAKAAKVGESWMPWIVAPSLDSICCGDRVSFTVLYPQQGACRNI